MIDISIILVTFNHQQEIQNCLKSIRAALTSYHAQIIFIDNYSSDRTVPNARVELEKFEPQHKWLIIQNSVNKGFTKAINQGLTKSQGKYILILNPDTELNPQLFPPLINIIEKNKKCGIVSPQFINSDGTIQPSCRRFPRHRDLLYTTFGLNKLFSNSPRFNYWQMGDFDFQTQRTVQQPQGAFLLTHRKALNQIGLLDETFPMFFSDVDWCRRFIEHGWEILFVPGVKIIHHKGGSIYKNRLKMIWSSHRSFYLYFKKYYHGKWWNVINLLTGELLILLAILRSIFYLISHHNSCGSN